MGPYFRSFVPTVSKLGHRTLTFTAVRDIQPDLNPSLVTDRMAFSSGNYSKAIIHLKLNVSYLKVTKI